MSRVPDGRRIWTRDELILAFNLYCQTPFGKIHNRNPKIIELATTIGRSASALSWKLANFARLDPTLRERNIRGAAHGSKQEEAIWDEFQSDWNQLALESERLRLGQQGLHNVEAELELPEGRTREALVQVRVNQAFFRRVVLAAYDSACCVTGLRLPELLSASHVVPWAVDVKNRTNPSNGLCLNALHDRAFDRGLMTITPDYRIIVSRLIAEESDTFISAAILGYAGQSIRPPDRFLPQQDFLEFHNKHVFRGV